MLLLIIILVGSILFSGCGGQLSPPLVNPPIRHESPVQEPSGRSFLLINLLSEPDSLNPLSSDPARLAVSRLIFNGLFRPGDSGPEPDLVKEFLPGDGNRSILIILKNEIRWHDGVEFTASDLLCTLEKIKETGSLTNLTSALESIEVIDLYNLKVHCKPAAAETSLWTFGMLPSHLLLKENLTGNSFFNQPTGTGPYRFLGWSKSSEILLDANPDYYEGSPGISRCIFRFEQPSVAMLKLKNHELDVLELSAEQVANQASDKEFQQAFRVLSTALEGTQTFAVCKDLNLSIFPDGRGLILQHDWVDELLP
ncbi:MAG: ABC transporter substrate-binding protein [Candidatus Wallbacteria bacterium]|nr:ABC transporter substrate-binding protein [Candidatus Wallbacteria bacterium]